MPLAHHRTRPTPLEIETAEASGYQSAASSVSSPGACFSFDSWPIAEGSSCEDRPSLIRPSTKEKKSESSFGFFLHIEDDIKRAGTLGRKTPFGERESSHPCFTWAPFRVAPEERDALVCHDGEKNALHLLSIWGAGAPKRGAE